MTPEEIHAKKAAQEEATQAPLTMELRADDLDEKGRFSGYLSRFDDVDAYGDTVKPGAFKKTLKGNPRRTLLWQHFTWEPIGVIELREDDVGLFIESGQINLDVQRGKEARSLLLQEAVTGLSMGFNVLHSDDKPNGEGRIVREVELWEGSLVTFPALKSAQVIEARDSKEAEQIRAVVLNVLEERDRAEKEQQANEEAREQRAAVEARIERRRRMIALLSPEQRS